MRSRVYLIVFRVGSNEFHQHRLVLVRNMDQESVFVAADIEDYAIVGDEIGRAELGSDVSWPRPLRLKNRAMPSSQRVLGRRMLLPKSSQRAQRDDLHREGI